MLLKLQSNDGKNFTIDECVALKSTLFREMLANTDNTSSSGENDYSVCDIEGEVLAKVIEFMEHHVDEKEIKEDDEDEFKEKELDEWDQNFFKVDYNMLADLLIASDQLDIKNLLLYTAKAVARNLAGKTTEEMREYCGEENDLPDVVPKDSSQEKDENNETKDKNEEKIKESDKMNESNESMNDDDDWEEDEEEEEDSYSGSPSEEDDEEDD